MMFGRDVLAAAPVQRSQLLKPIPASGERIPGVGLGTASSFSAAARTPEEHAALREVLREFTSLGGAVIDTSPSYGRSEETIGELVREIGNADDIFMATKVSGADGREEGLRQVNRSAERLAPGNIDLNQVHNLGDWETQLPLLRELKQEGRIRYLGVTVSSPRRYEELEHIMRSEPLDFVQLDYAIDNRDVEQTLLPLAVDRGMATLINGPFGRTRLFRRVGDRPVPDWAGEFGATSWAQFFLKWLLGSPAVTVVIPATSDPRHLRDNMGAGLGRLPSEAERTRMAQLIESLPGG
jgi:aryl-alcohol dehydrogenase-like predicted oxidoreductase